MDKQTIVKFNDAQAKFTDLGINMAKDATEKFDQMLIKLEKEFGAQQLLLANARGLTQASRPVRERAVSFVSSLEAFSRAAHTQYYPMFKTLMGKGNTDGAKKMLDMCVAAMASNNSKADDLCTALEQLRSQADTYTIAAQNAAFQAAQTIKLNDASQKKGFAANAAGGGAAVGGCALVGLGFAGPVGWGIIITGCAVQAGGLTMQIATAADLGNLNMLEKQSIMIRDLCVTMNTLVQSHRREMLKIKQSIQQTIDATNFVSLVLSIDTALADKAAQTAGASFVTLEGKCSKWLADERRSTAEVFRLLGLER